MTQLTVVFTKARSDLRPTVSTASNKQRKTIELRPQECANGQQTWNYSMILPRKITSDWWDQEHMSRATETQRSQSADGKGTRKPMKKEIRHTPKGELKELREQLLTRERDPPRKCSTEVIRKVSCWSTRAMVI